MRVYLAGAYSADNVIDVLQNIGRGEYYGAELFGRGYDPFVPWFDAKFVKILWDCELSVERFRDYSLSWLEVSDAMLVLPNFEKSKGTLAEIKLANELNIPVFYDLNELDEYADSLVTSEFNRDVVNDIMSENNG